MSRRDEIEDGMGCAGLVPTAAERREEREAEKAKRTRLDVVLLRNCLGNLYVAVQRFGRKPECPVDLDVQFAMREAARALGPPYSELETCALCGGTKQTYPAGSFEPKPCPTCSTVNR